MSRSIDGGELPEQVTVSADSLGSTSLIRQCTSDSDDGLYLPYRDGYLDPDAYLRAVLHIHFHEEYGTPYWLDVAEDLDFDPLDRISTYEDLFVLPEADEDALIARPATDFMPRLYTASQIDLSKSSGTTGPKKVMPWLKTATDEIVDWYDWRLEQAGTGTGNWMVMGPPGLYEKHLEMAAIRRGGLCYFTGIETRRLKSQLSALRALKERPVRTAIRPSRLLNVFKGHARISPALTAVKEELASEPIKNIASAPGVVLRIHEMLTADETVSSPADIDTVLISGTTVTPAIVDTLDEKFLNATVIPMYATSFTGAAFSYPPAAGLSYFPLFPLVKLDVIDGDPASPFEDRNVVQHDQRGQVVIHRIGEDFFWPNQLERETAVRRQPAGDIEWDGISDIAPIER